MFVAALFLVLSSPSWAQRSPSFRLSQGARANWRESTGLTSEAVSRMEIVLLRRARWRVLPFFETRRAVARDAWSRLELGVEIATKPFLGSFPPFSWLTLASGFQQAWLSPGSDHPEWEVRALFDVPIPKLKVRSTPAGFYLLNEYTYDLEEGAGVRNETGVGVLVPLPMRHFSLLLGWRHVDRVHFTDVDQFEGSLIAEF